MANDYWHYPRQALAEQILGMFSSGMSNALTFFAPRRMGKTECLRKDIQPLAENQGWKTFYFSFLDAGPEAASAFTGALAEFSRQQSGAIDKVKRAAKHIKKLSGEAIKLKAEIELQKSDPQEADVKGIILKLAKNNTLLLLDEVQELAKSKANAQFIASLRTALDINKDSVKVIFTGSSQAGLRQMFSKSDAPFFHFGQNLPFPEFDQGFTDHLTEKFKSVTGRELNSEKLWQAFIDMDKVPQLARSLVERLALNPNIKLSEAKKQLLDEIINDRAFIETWKSCSELERLILINIANDAKALFSNEAQQKFSKKLGVDKIAIPSIQSSIRALQNKGLIGVLSERGSYFVDDPNFKSWVQELHFD